MSQIIDEAVDYIVKSPYALLITIDENKRPSSRYIGPVVNNGLDIYFLTRMDSIKTEHIRSSPFVSLIFQSPEQTIKMFRCVTINGRAEYLQQGNEFDDIWEKMGSVSAGYKEYVGKEGFKIWAMYKVIADSVQLVDLSKSTRTLTEKIKNYD